MPRKLSKKKAKELMIGAFLDHSDTEPNEARFYFFTVSCDGCGIDYETSFDYEPACEAVERAKKENEAFAIEDYARREMVKEMVEKGWKTIDTENIIGAILCLNCEDVNNE